MFCAQNSTPIVVTEMQWAHTTHSQPHTEQLEQKQLQQQQQQPYSNIDRVNNRPTDRVLARRMSAHQSNIEHIYTQLNTVSEHFVSLSVAVEGKRMTQHTSAGYASRICLEQIFDSSVHAQFRSVLHACSNGRSVSFVDTQARISSFKWLKNS